MNTFTKIIKRFLLLKPMAKIFLKPMLRLHSFSYEMSGAMSAKVETTHPKHWIINYFEWFNSKISPEDIVLDIGCNTGKMVNHLSQKAKFVYGIEINPDLIKIANENYRSVDNLEFICGDATSFDVNTISRKISIVTLSNVLEHIESRVDFLKKIIKNTNWQNEPLLLIRVPLITREWIAPYKKQMGVEWRLDQTHFTEYTPEEFEQEIKLAGLKINNSKINYGELFCTCSLSSNH